MIEYQIIELTPKYLKNGESNFIICKQHPQSDVRGESWTVKSYYTGVIKDSIYQFFGTITNAHKFSSFEKAKDFLIDNILKDQYDQKVVFSIEV